MKHEESWIAELDERIAKTKQKMQTDRAPILREILRLQESARANWAVDLEKMRAEEDRKRKEKLEQAGILSLLRTPKAPQ